MHVLFHCSKAVPNHRCKNHRFYELKKKNLDFSNHTVRNRFIYCVFKDIYNIKVTVEDHLFLYKKKPLPIKSHEITPYRKAIKYGHRQQIFLLILFIIFSALIAHRADYVVCFHTFAASLNIFI